MKLQLEMNHLTTTTLKEIEISNLNSIQNNTKDAKTKTKKTTKGHKEEDVSTTSILIIGASGRTGLSCLRRFSRHREMKVNLDAFVQDASKLSNADKLLCNNIIEGDARKESDIRSALKQSNAKIILVCIGNGNDEDKNQTNVRTASARALANVMKQSEFKHVRALVMSRSKVDDNGGGIIGKFIKSKKSNELRNVLEDHDGQEEAFLSSSSLRKRVTIVRPTMLTDKAKATASIQEFTQDEKPPTSHTPREDLATWIVYEICCGIRIGNRVANITGASPVRRFRA